MKRINCFYCNNSFGIIVIIETKKWVVFLWNRKANEVSPGGKYRRPGRDGALLDLSVKEGENRKGENRGKVGSRISHSPYGTQKFYIFLI